MTVEILPRAADDIIRQFLYYLVEQDAPETAVHFREAVIQSLDRLKVHPRIGSFVRSTIPDLRGWPVKGFSAIRVYYVGSPDRVLVVRVLHGKRNVRRILQGEHLH